MAIKLYTVNVSFLAIRAHSLITLDTTGDRLMLPRAGETSKPCWRPPFELDGIHHEGHAPAAEYLSPIAVVIFVLKEGYHARLMVSRNPKGCL